MAATGTPTPNIGLRIPLGTDPASVDDINYNSNLIDTKLGAVGEDSVQDQIDDLNSKMSYETEFPTTYDTTKLTSVVGLRRSGIVQVKIDIKAGLAQDWHNSIATGLSIRFRPASATYGCYRVNAGADVSKNAIAILNTDGTLQFLPSAVFNADIPFSFTFISAID